MIKQLIVGVFILCCYTSLAQNNMRSTEELINTEEPAWPMVEEWIKAGKNKITVLPADSSKAKDALYKTQVTTRSPMGAIVYHTGGILIDEGWIRILGSGSEKLSFSLPAFNKGKSFKEFGEAPAFLLVAYDAVGGFFIINGGAMGPDVGKMYYLSPDNLTYESMDLSYTDFLDFCFNNNLEKFYKGLRWKDWKKEMEVLKADQVFTFFPYLWTKEGNDINKVERKAVPVDEQYNLNIEMRKQLGLDK